MNRNLSLCSAALLAILFSGCSGGGGGSSTATGSGSTTKLGIATNLPVNASTTKGFFIAPSGMTVADMSGSKFEKFFNYFSIKSAYAALGTNSSIYSLNADNSITEVNISTLITTDSSGKSTTSTNTNTSNVSATGVYNTPNFLLISYTGLTANGQTCSVVPVRKSDGALFCITATPGTAFNPNYVKPIQTDATGNIVFILDYSGVGLTKFDLSNPSSPTSSVLVNRATDGNVTEMSVNSAGDVFAGISNNSANSWRIYSATGGFQNITTSASCLTNGYTGDDNNFYYYDNTGTLNVPGVPTIFKLTKSAGTFNQTTYFADTGGSVGIQTCSEYNTAIIKGQSRIFMFSLLGIAVNYFTEVVNASNTPAKWTVGAFNTINTIYGYSGGIMVQGQDVSGNSGIVYFNTSNNTFTTILTPGLYSITKMDVAPNGDVTFMGRRASDNARVIGTIPVGTSTVTVISQNLNADATQLVRIN